MPIITAASGVAPEPLAVPGLNPLPADRYGTAAALTIGNSRQVFRWIAPGRFMMGSPLDEAERSAGETPHEVILTRGFWLADTTCTQAFWLAVWPVNPSHFQEHPNNPVENVSWHDTQGFLAELNRRLPGLAARLPSEAEWEYACRAGSTSAYAFGETIDTGQANFNGEYPCPGAAKGLYRQRTVPVDALPANAWGLYQMHGNVWEWCADWFADYPSTAQQDPRGPKFGKMRVLRGGTWGDPARYLRSATRSRIEPAYRPRSSGFRIALGGV